MKLYYSPGACSLSPHIVLEELGLPYTAVKVDLKVKQTADGADYTQINSKGSVPALELDDGQLLTEGPAVVQYLADQKPEAGLAPPAGTPARYRLMEMLNFITSELHKGFSPLFDPAATPEWKAGALDHLKKKFDWLAGYMTGKQFVMGDHFTVADAYLFTVLGWTRPMRIDLGAWPALKEFHTRIGHRAPVQAAMRAEGLVK